MNRRAAAQLRVIKAVTAELGSAGISAWLFGGWGLDARIGRITREHGDIEFWVERCDAGRSKAVLAGAGATALTTQPPTEACEFTWDGVDFSTAYFDRQPGGSFSQPRQKDIDDITTLRRLAVEAADVESQTWPVRPLPAFIYPDKDTGGFQGLVYGHGQVVPD